MALKIIGMGLLKLKIVSGFVGIVEMRSKEEDGGEGGGAIEVGEGEGRRRRR